jgi:acyl-homoserine-lactone acylase
MTEHFSGVWRPLSIGVAVALLAACGGSNDGDNASIYKADIRRTSLGVPHIKADTWGGAGYGYGYAQAEDNLCTMADSFVTYRGERSKFFGADARLVARGTTGRPINIDSDFFHKHLITSTVIDAMVAAQSNDIREMVDGFTAGYNRYLKDFKAGSSQSHAACRNEAWVTNITATDIYRRMYEANLAGGYSNFVANIANAKAPTTTLAAASQANRAQAAAVQLAALNPSLTQAPELQVGGEEGVGSNMIGYGTAATGTSSPLLFGNPHWYWRGPDRFYQAQLTIPGKLNVSGSSFLGIPMILIGYNENVAWSHTVSTARRFGFFQLTLASGDPTSYLRDGVAVKMTANSVTVDVKQTNGTIAPVTRTLYRTPQGPLVNLGLLNPALGWSQTTAFVIRDINADNYRTFRNWLRWNQATSLDDFIKIQKEESAIPWVNTVAVGKGSAKAWYADIGAVPNVSAEQLTTCATPFGAAVAGALPRVPFLDGSRSACDWKTDADSVQAGALPPSKMPGLMREDYAANMNDSYWLSNPKEPLTGFSGIMGPAGTESVTLRTRLGHLMAQGRLDGSDGYPGNKATVDIVKQMVLNSRVYSAELFKAQALPVVCADPTIAVARDPQTGETFVTPKVVNVALACNTLQAWDNTGNTNSRGAHVWDEFWARASLLSATDLYAVSFSAADPVNTPNTLRTTNPARLKEAFGAAVLRVQQSGYAEDAVRGDYLFATRSSTKIPLFGGCGSSGYFTIACSENRLDQGGYNMDGNPNGNSYMQIVTFPATGVQAHTFLTFSLSDDPASPHNADYTRQYSGKQWVRMPFTEAEITSSPDYRSKNISE